MTEREQSQQRVKQSRHDSVWLHKTAVTPLFQECPCCAFVKSAVILKIQR